jgi:hypothetical protein
MALTYDSRPVDSPHLATRAEEEEEGDQEVPRHAPSQQCEGQKKTDTKFYHLMSWRRLSIACGIEVDELARKSSADAWSALLPIVNGVLQNI